MAKAAVMSQSTVLPTVKSNSLESPNKQAVNAKMNQQLTFKNLEVSTQISFEKPNQSTLFINTKAYHLGKTRKVVRQ